MARAARAPTAASMLHAGVLMKLGAYGILRVAVYLFPEGARYWSHPTAMLALCNIVYGAMVATRQKDLKYIQVKYLYMTGEKHD